MTSIFYGALAWSIAASVVLLATALFARQLRNASLRHWCWLIAFCGVAVLPLLVMRDWSANTRSLTARIERLESLAGAGDAACVATSPNGPGSHPLSFVALVAWLAGTAFVLGRAGWALLLVNLWRRQSTEFDLPGDLFANAFRNVGIRIAGGEFPAAPITSGFRRPIILLPRGAEAWSESRVAAILWHELGHIRRGDNLTQLLVLVITALHWFNPVFWFAARRMEAEAEMAADDFAILRGVTPSHYATELLAVATELSSRGWKSPVAHPAMAKAFTLEERLRAIINPKSERGRTPPFAFAKIATLFLGLALLFTQLTPRVVFWLKPEVATPPPDCVAPAAADHVL